MIHQLVSMLEAGLVLEKCFPHLLEILHNYTEVLTLYLTYECLKTPWQRAELHLRTKRGESTSSTTKFVQLTIKIFLGGGGYRVWSGDSCKFIIFHPWHLQWPPRHQRRTRRERRSLRGSRPTPWRIHPGFACLVQPRPS